MPDGPMPPPGRSFQRLERCAGFPYRPSEYLRRFLWEWVQRTFVRFSPRRANGWRRFWVRLFGAKLDHHVLIRPTTTIVHPWLLTMGEYAALADGVTIYNLGPVTIGPHSVISQDVYVCAGTHDYTKPDLPLQRPPIVIGAGVWICAGAFIAPGVTIGDNVVVGARAVVARDIPPGVVVAGNPARVIKPRPMGGEPPPPPAGTH